MPHLILWSVYHALWSVYSSVAPYTGLFDLYAQVAMIDELVMQWCVKIMSN